MTGEIVRALLCVAVLTGCTVVHGTGELMGITCEWQEWKPTSDPGSDSAVRPEHASPDDDVCYIVWADSHTRVALAAHGDSADDISCSERTSARPTQADPLVVRPGQIGWIFGRYGGKPPEVWLSPVVCAELDAWTDAGGAPSEFPL